MLSNETIKSFYGNNGFVYSCLVFLYQRAGEKNGIAYVVSCGILNGINTSDLIIVGRPKPYYSPGCEFLYSRSLYPNLEIVSGLSLNKSVYVGSIKVLESDFSRKFENLGISFPLIAKKSFPIGVFRIFVSGGFYFGKIINIKTSFMTRTGWVERKELKTIPFYSEDTYFSDFYFDFGASVKSGNHSSFALYPFLCYRLNTTWLSNFHERYFFGLKINYQIKV